MTGSVEIMLAVQHRLCAAWLFNDAFSGRPIATPLNVQVSAITPPYPSMPGLPWVAVRGQDSTYRFLVSNATLAPTGTIAVSVNVPTLDYASFEPLSMTLPRPVSVPYPQRSDFLLTANLWPTRLLAVAPGETAVIGTITNAAHAPVPGLRVTMWSSVHATPPPGTPYTYTDDNGDFLFRLLGPDFRVSVTGGVVTTTANVSISLLAPPTYTTVVTPTTPFPQTVNLGRINTMPIGVP